MATSIPTAPRAGYSAQAELSLEIARSINNGRMTFWCASEVNPPANELASNPIEIYLQLERLTRGGRLAPDAAKRTSLKRRLRRWIDSWFDAGLIETQQRYDDVRALVTLAKDGDFEPVMFNLVGITLAHDQAQPDEFVVNNVSLSAATTKPVEPSRIWA